MSENSHRTYFSFRYAIPGYTLILLFIGVNCVPLLEFARNTKTPEFFAAILAFVSLLTGSALGFLVSQVWWWWFHRKGGIFGIKEFEGYEKLLDNKCKNLPIRKGEKRPVMEAILDFLIFVDKNERLTKVVHRRWDIYHVLSSTYHTLRLGLVAGVVFRILFEHFVYRTLLSTTIFLDRIRFFGQNAENMTLIPVIIAAVLILLIIGKQRKNHIARYYPLHEALVRRSLKTNKDELRNAFPKYFVEQGTES